MLCALVYALGGLSCTLALEAVAHPASGQGGLSASSFVLEWSVGPLADKGAPIAQSSPMVATLDNGGPAVVVGDRAGHLYAYHLSDGSAVPGWPVDVGAPVDSTPSVALLSGSSYDTVFVGAGDAGAPNVGGYYAFSASGQQLWHSTVQSLPIDPHPATGVQASLTFGDIGGQEGVFAGSLDQLGYALDVANGRALYGWPFFDADSVFSTAALADLYGTGQDELVVGGASTAGLALGQAYPQGGHVRVLDGEGHQLYDYDPDQEVDSSPAVGDFLAGGQPGIVVGTGNQFKGASDTDALMAFTTRLQPVWTDHLDGVTSSSPAIADVLGNGSLDVVEGTDTGSGGSVWVLDGADGSVIWHQSVVGRVIGSVVAADLTGQGYQDLLVPTTQGVEVLDGRSGAEVTVLGGKGGPGGQFGTLGFQNSPLVTDDPDGAAGITVAGYNGNNQGVVEHFEVRGSDGALAVGTGSWPMFHHDPALSGAAAPLPDLGRPVMGALSATAGNGQVTLSWAAPSSGGSSPVDGYNVYEATSPGHEGATPLNGSTPVTGGTYTVTGLTNGKRYYFEVTALNSAGEGSPSVEATAVPFGLPGAPGSLAGTPGSGQVVLTWQPPTSNGGSAVTAYDVYVSTSPGDKGALVATVPGTTYTATGLVNGSTYYFEVSAVNAAGEGPTSAQVAAVPVAPGTPAAPTSTTVPAPTTTSVPARAPAEGYRLVGSNGQVFSFGKLPMVSGPSVRAAPSNPVVGAAAAPDGRGYWLALADGQVLAAGDAHLFGSLAGRAHLNRPIVGIAATPDGRGYWLVASDGGIFAFGDARFYGSTGHIHLNRPIVGIAATPDGRGYWLVASDGGIFAFGDAGYYGSLVGKKLAGRAEVVGIAP